MLLQKKLLLSLLLLLTAGSLTAQSNFDQGLAWYQKRDEGATGIQAKEEPINKAIFYFERALNQPESEAQASVYLLKSYFFKGTFVLKQEKDKENLFKKGMELGEYMSKKYPNNAAVALWYMINMGKWADIKGAMAAATNGIASKMKELSERIISLDPNNEEAAAYRALGVLHFRAPKIPLVMTWPDKTKSLEMLKKATEVAPENPGNHVAYAEVLYGEGQKNLAIKILQTVTGRKPRKDLQLEDKMELKEAEDLLKKYLGQ